MMNMNKTDIARKLTGVLLVGVGSSALIGVLLYLAPHILRWLRNYPVWATFLVGFVVFSLGAFLAVSEHIKAAKKAHETDNDSYQEGS